MYRMISIFITVLYAALSCYLLLLAGFSSTAIDANEHSYLLKDHMILQLALVALICFGGVTVYQKSERIQRFVRHINESEEYSCKWRKRLLLTLAVLSTVIVLILQVVPRGDQRFICDMANSMMNGDYYGFDRGQYLDWYPNQIGIVLLLYGLAHIFGSYNYLIFQLMNVAALLSVYHDFASLSDETGHSRFAGLTIIAVGILFLPAILYTTYVYGILLGFAFSIRALRRLRKLLWGDTKVHSKESRWKQVRCMAADLFLLGTDAFAAVAVKTNYRIFLIALLIYVFLSLLKREKRRYNLLWTFRALCAAGVLLVVLLLSQRVINKAAAAITGRDISSGLSPWSWVTMGLQKNSDRYDGWYNGYGLNTYSEANSSGERQKLIAQEDLAERVQFFRDHPMYALSFFSGKNASQWNNPDFQSFWIVQHARRTVQYSRIINWIFSPGGNALLNSGLNFLQFAILFGAVLCILPKEKGAFRDKREPEDLFLACCVIGGFLFYSFWEAKAQYTLVHFMCLIPLSVYGYERMRPCRFIRMWGTLLLISVLLLIGRKSEAISSIFLRGEDTISYQQYLQDHRYVRLENAYLEALEERLSLVFSDYDNHCYLISSDERALTADDASLADADMEGVHTELSPCVYTAAQSWYLRRSDEEDRYYLIHIYEETELALTRDSFGNIILQPFEESEFQKWTVQIQK